MLNMTVHGRLGRDAELNETPQGTKVCNFAVAADTRNKETVWHSCALWGAYGETMHRYLKKGLQVCVSGEWEPQQGKNGNTYYNLRVTQMSLGADPRGQRQDQETETESQEEPLQEDDLSDIPF